MNKLKIAYGDTIYFEGIIIPPEINYCDINNTIKEELEIGKVTTIFQTQQYQVYAHVRDEYNTLICKLSSINVSINQYGIREFTLFYPNKIPVGNYYIDIKVIDLNALDALSIGGNVTSHTDTMRLIVKEAITEVTRDDVAYTVRNDISEYKLTEYIIEDKCSCCSDIKKTGNTLIHKKDYELNINNSSKFKMKLSKNIQVQSKGNISWILTQWGDDMSVNFYYLDEKPSTWTPRSFYSIKPSKIPKGVPDDFRELYIVDDNGILIYKDDTTCCETLTVDSIAKLRTIEPQEDNQRMFVAGYHANSNIGGGEFYSKLNSSDADNAGTIIKTANGHAWIRISKELDVTHYGAKGDGITDDTEAVKAMQKVSNIVFNSGLFKLSSIDITKSMHFKENAAITVDSGNTVNIHASIQSSKQYIFKGEGNYSLGHDINTDIGEESRYVHISWFGAKPHGWNSVDQSDYIQKCFDSLGNSRESTIKFDTGNYYITKTLLVPRAAHILGKGQRRTVFRVTTEGFDVFKTNEEGSTFEGIQFEIDKDILGYRKSGYFINVQHRNVSILNCSMGESTHCIGIFGHTCYVKNILAVFGADHATHPDATLINIQANAARISDIRMPTSKIGPTNIIRIGGETTNNLSGISIDNVYGIVNHTYVKLDATIASMGNININNITYNGFGTLKAPNVIHLYANNEHTIKGVNISNVPMSGQPEEGIRIESKGKSYIANVNMSNIYIGGRDGNGINIIEETGQVWGIVMDRTVQIDRDNPIVYTGSPRFYKMDYENTPLQYDLDIPKDTVQTIEFPNLIPSGMAIITVGDGLHGTESDYLQLAFRASTPVKVKSITQSSAIFVKTSALTGTTVPDGRFGVGVQDKTLYFENRKANTQRVQVLIIAKL